MDLKKLLIISIMSLCTFCVNAQDATQIQLANEYYVNGELEKAISIYEDLAEDTRNIALIHSNYFDLLINSERFKAAERYIKRNIKLFRGNDYYKIDYGILLLATKRRNRQAMSLRRSFNPSEKINTD